jgi:hypothetical protein
MSPNFFGHPGPFPPVACVLGARQPESMDDAARFCHRANRCAPARRLLALWWLRSGRGCHGPDPGRGAQRHGRRRRRANLGPRARLPCQSRRRQHRAGVRPPLAALVRVVLRLYLPQAGRLWGFVTSWLFALVYAVLAPGSFAALDDFAAPYVSYKVGYDVPWCCYGLVHLTHHHALRVDDVEGRRGSPRRGSETSTRPGEREPQLRRAVEGVDLLEALPIPPHQPGGRAAR